MLPWILIAAFISIWIFYYFSKRAMIRREDMRDRRRERQQEYLDSLLKSSKKENPKSNEDNAV